MKKFLAFTLALTMTAAMFASCGKTDSSSVADTDSAAETTTAADTASSDAASDATSDAASDATSDADSSAADSSAAETTKSDGKTTTAAKSDDGKTTTAAKNDGKTTTTAAKSDSGKTTTTTAKKAVSKAKPVSEIPSTLKNYSTASVKFKTSMKVSDFASPFAELKKSGVNKGKAYTPNTDESKIKLSIEKVAGIPMIRVQTLQRIKNKAKTDWAIPKVQLDVSQFFKGHEDQLPKVFTIKMDVVSMAVGKFTADDGTKSLVPGNFMGALATKTGTDVSSLEWTQQGGEVKESEWTSKWGSYEVMGRPGVTGGQFVNTKTSQYVCFMRWSIPNQADFYIADITFLDENNNVIKCAKFQ